MDWWKGFFDEHYLRRYIIEDEDTIEEVLMLRDLLPEAPADLLDVACGSGRHSLALALVGYSVTGLDASVTLLDKARKAADLSGVAAEFVEADVRMIPYVECFDAAINMFTSFGYFTDDAENQQVLDGIARALKPGGRLVMDLAHRDRVLANYRETDWYELDDGTVVWVQRIFDPVRGVNTVVDRWRNPDGSEDERYMRLRLYTATELDRMLRAAGLTSMTWYGSTRLHAFTPQSRRMIVLAEKTG